MSDLLQQEFDRIEKAVNENAASGRAEVCLLAPKGSVGLEAGVDTGQLSKRFLDLNHLGILHSVDKWDDHAHSREQYLGVARLLQGYPRSKVWRMTAQEFSTLLPDASLGFIYIDCYAHTGQDDGSVLTALWPKLKAGGIFSGDDYDKKQWPRTCKVVTEFANKHDYTINLRTGFIKSAKSGRDRHPTWWFRK